MKLFRPDKKQITAAQELSDYAEELSNQLVSVGVRGESADPLAYTKYILRRCASKIRELEAAKK